MDAELVRLCLEGIRTFCGSILSVTIAVGTASRLLGRRKSTVPIFCYYYAKQFFAGILLGQVLGFYCGKLAWYRLGYAVLISVLAIVTFWFNCYTFEGDLLKVAVGAWIGELVCVFILNFTFMLVNFLEKRENVLALPALPELADLLVFLIGFGMYGIFLRIFSPFLEGSGICGFKDGSFCGRCLELICCWPTPQYFSEPRRTERSGTPFSRLFSAARPRCLACCCAEAIKNVWNGRTVLWPFRSIWLTLTGGRWRIRCGTWNNGGRRQTPG